MRRVLEGCEKGGARGGGWREEGEGGWCEEGVRRV